MMIYSSVFTNDNNDIWAIMNTGYVSISRTSSTIYLKEISGVYGIQSYRSEYFRFGVNTFKVLQMSYLRYMYRGDELQ